MKGEETTFEALRRGMAQIDPPHCVLEIDDQFTPGPNPGPGTGPGPGILGWQVSRLLLDFDGSGFSRFTCTDWPLWEGITSSVLPSSSIHQPFAFCDGGPDPPTMTILESELESKSESESELESESGLGLQRKPKFSVIQITWRTQALIRSPPLRLISWIP